MTTNTLRDKFTAVETDLGGVCFEREHEIRGILIGLLASRHLYMLGEPGVGKTFLVDQVFRRIDGAKKFETLLARTSLPEQIYGPVDLGALAGTPSRFRRDPTGKLQEADLAILDEIFKCNSAILNTLLPILNERRYDDGGKPVKIPLISMVAASNELPQGEDLNAMYDRLHLRYVVHRLQEDANFERLVLLTGIPPHKASVTLDEIRAGQRDTLGVKVGPVAVDGIKKARLGCDKQGIRVSDRKWRELVAILQAEAWLNGHAEVLADDLAILQHVLWSTPEERKKVIEVVFAIACPSMPRALEIVDLAAEQRRAAKAEPDKLSDSFKKLRLLSDEIEKLATGADASRFAQLRVAANKVKAMRMEVGELLVGGKV